MKDWVTRFGVQIILESLILTKTGFYKIPSLSPQGGRREKRIFKHNTAPNYLTMMELHME